jgi:ESS family glutamate:Na+ symporter
MLTWYRGGSIGAEISPELLGVGYIIGPRISATMLAGGVLGQMSATVGLVTGVVGGVWLIQWGARRGHTRAIAAPMSASGESAGLLPVGRRPSIATGTVSPVVIEPFTLHLAAIGLSLLAGMALLEGLRRLHPMFDAFPLFPLAMLGGMAVQAVTVRLGIDDWFDRASFQRLSGLALDLLVVSAVASMRLDLFAQHLAPFALLMVAAMAWCVASFVWLAPLLLPDDWFEQGLVVYGTQTGVAAVGLMLLRIADPEQQTSAARAFAARSVVISPLLGGGLITAAMPLLVVQSGIGPMLVVAALVTAGAWFWPGRRGATR